MQIYFLKISVLKGISENFSRMFGAQNLPQINCYVRLVMKKNI